LPMINFWQLWNTLDYDSSFIFPWSLVLLWESVTILLELKWLLTFSCHRSYNYTQSERDLLKNATRYHLLLVLDSWEKTALVAKSKLSTSIQNRAKVLENTRIDIDMIAVFRKSKAYYWRQSTSKYCCCQ